MFSNILSWLGELGPAFTNVYWGYLAYCAVEHHAYSIAAGVGTYIVLNEFDSVKRHFRMYGRR